MSRHDARSSIAAERARGMEDGRRFTAGAMLLRESDMGAFSNGARWTSVVLRRTLLRLRVPPGLLARSRSFIAWGRRAAAFDRFLRRYAYWHGVHAIVRSGPTWRGLLRGPVILMYHAVGGPGEQPSCYVLPRRRFRMQMAWLKWRGYHVVSLSELVAHLRDNRVPPPRSVVLTFDDGFADNAEEALPVLSRYGFRATVFAVSEAVGRRAWWPQNEALINRPMLTATQVADLMRSGMELGAHTRTHPSLTEVDAATQAHEISGSRAQLSALVQRPVVAFAYPFGDRNPAARGQVEAAGFQSACCSRSGFVDPSAPLFELPRIEVRGTDSLLDFAFLLWRGHRRLPSNSASSGFRQVTA